MTNSLKASVSALAIAIAFPAFAADIVVSLQATIAPSCTVSGSGSNNGTPSGAFDFGTLADSGSGTIAGSGSHFGGSFSLSCNGTHTITMTSPNNGELVYGTESIPYSAEFSTLELPTGTNEVSTQVLGGAMYDETSLKVNVGPTSLTDKAPGTYTDTLTISINPSTGIIGSTISDAPPTTLPGG